MKSASQPTIWTRRWARERGTGTGKVGWEGLAAVVWNVLTLRASMLCVPVCVRQPISIDFIPLGLLPAPPHAPAPDPSPTATGHLWGSCSYYVLLAVFCIVVKHCQCGWQKDSWQAAAAEHRRVTYFKIFISCFSFRSCYWFKVHFSWANGK